MESDSDASKQRRPDCKQWRAADVVPLTREVFKGPKHLDAVAERARREGIKREVLIEPELVLIVVELRAARSPLKRDGQAPRVRVTRLKREKVPGNLRYEQAFKRSVRGKLQHCGVEELVAA